MQNLLTIYIPKTNNLKCEPIYLFLIVPVRANVPKKDENVKRKFFTFLILMIFGTKSKLNSRLC